MIDDKMTDAERDLHNALLNLVDLIRRGRYCSEGGPLTNNGTFLEAEDLITKRELALRTKPRR